jgi:hypothetical protein
VAQQLRVTPTTADPLVATLFAIESQRFGRGVVLASRQAEVQHLIQAPNVLNEIEREVAIGVSPLEFKERFVHWICRADIARNILAAMGYALPELVGSKVALSTFVKEFPRLNESKIEEFNRQAFGVTTS